MKQYQMVITKLQVKAREDEEMLTDLLNERARTGVQLLFPKRTPRRTRSYEICR